MSRVFGLFVVASVVLGGACSIWSAVAADYPTQTVKLIVPVAAGTATDTYTRLLATHLQDAFASSVVVENRPGALGTIAAGFVARAKPDGHTLFVTTNTTQSAVKVLMKSVPYDPQNDFTSVARMGNIPSIILVHPSLPVRTLSELIAYAKSHPGEISYGTGNSTGVIVGGSLQRRAGIDIVEVRYNSIPPAMKDFLGGQIKMIVADIVNALPQIEAGNARAIAVPSGERLKQLPDVPTIAESGFPGFELVAWIGLFGPADVPQAIVERYNVEITKFLASPGVRERLWSLGLEPFTTPQAEFARFVRAEYPKWIKGAQDAGMTPQ